MHYKPVLSFRRSVLVLAAAVLLSSFAAAATTVTKVEPPNWWIGLTPNLMLLLTGEALDSATVSTEYPGVHVKQVQAQPGGRYAFVWLDVSSSAKPGTVPLAVKTAQGKAVVQFPLLERGNIKGQFEGISRDDIIYLIMPDRFADGDSANNMPKCAGDKTFDRAAASAYHGGDLKGIRERLPYMKELGITAIWLTPIWAQDVKVSDYHGYHPVDFYAVDPHLGTMRDYRELVETAHSAGIKVFIDFVVNHTGPTHPWAQQPPTSTWLNGTPEKHLKPDYDFWFLVDPHATPRQSTPVLQGWFADKLPDLNPDDPLLTKYLVQNATWWMESSHADGFRLDTFPYSSRKFWSAWHKGIFEVYPRTFTIAEAWNSDPIITSFFQGGRKQWDGIDSGASTVFDFPFFSTVREVILRGAPAKRLSELFRQDALYPDATALVTFVGNHDTKRFMGEEGATPQKLKAALTLLATARGIPQLYSGDEIAMAGGDDPDNRRDFPGGFPGDSRSAFTSAGRSESEQDVLAHVKKMLALRRQHIALREGRQWTLVAGETCFAFARESGADRLLVVLNSGSSSHTVRVNLAETALAGTNSAQPLLEAEPAKVSGGTVEITVAPYSAAVYELK